MPTVHDNAVAACHSRLMDSDQVSYNWQHYIPVIEKKPGALRNGAPFAELPGTFAATADCTEAQRTPAGRSNHGKSAQPGAAAWAGSCAGRC